jgi:CheY-like chemotaxis protein
MTRRPTDSAIASTQSSNDPSDGGSRAADRVARILLVDDDPLVLDALSGWLEAECGAEVIACTSAEQAMALTSPARFDVCILDYQLTGADGLTLGAMLRELNPATRLILLSGNLSPAVESLALEHGFGRIFRKPVSPKHLIDAIIL